MKKLFSPLNLVLALALTLFIIAAAVVVTLISARSTIWTSTC